MDIKDVVNVGVGIIASTAKNVVAAATTPPVEQAVAPATEQKPVEQAPPPKQVEPPAVPNENIVANNNIDITTKPIPKEDSKVDGASKETTQSTEGKTEKKPITGLLATTAGLTEPTNKPTPKENETNRKDSAMRRDAIANIRVASNNPNFEPTYGKYSAATMNNTERELPSESSAKLYKERWDLQQEGKTLIFKKGAVTKKIEKKSEEEAKYVKELLRPTGVDSYEANQTDNGNCATLSQIQHAFLTGERIDKIAEKIKYNYQTKEVAISLVDNKTLESKDYIFNQAQIERGKTDGKTDAYYGTIAKSKTHQDINTFMDLALRQHSGGNNEELKNNYALDPKNLYARMGVLQKALDPIKEPTYYAADKTGKIVQKKVVLDRFSLEQLAEMQKTAPEAGITLWINRGDKITKNSGLYAPHAYSLISVDLKTRTALVVNPHDSSKLLKITDATQFFDSAFVENL